MSTSVTASAGALRSGALEVPRGGGKCAVSGRLIEPGEKYFAAIRENPAAVERLDVAPECWDGIDKAGLLAFWRTVMPKPDEKRKIFVDDEVLCSLFERLADALEPAKVSFRFVLGLILMRKRLVIYDMTRHDQGKDVWVVRLKGKPEQMDLLDPKLDERQMAEVSQQLGQILNENL
ncbi:MAG TPA: hypothetical protein VG326_20490 [Tepidisphaeraceae bacterium]|jgi:hypothetical protein|nr:hypothetical protein [Tepidisphaeraceae bacterium]